MRIINKKYLLVILLVGVILTGVIIFKPNKKVQLDNVILKQEVNNKTFAMYKEDKENNYIKVEDTKFPEGYALNVTESNCIDNNGNEIKNALSYENGEVTITSGKTIYCYLYFDKTLGIEIKEKEPKGLKTDKIRGAMYRYQGQAKDLEGNELVNNYICFGTSDKDTCNSDTDKYMYRIIGIEASTGRVKVIKKEALNEIYPWYIDSEHDIDFPNSTIYKAISGTDFMQNKDYIPNGWENKISDNIWTYGDMHSNNNLGARQTGEGLYLVETGQKETRWDVKAEKDDPGAQPYVVQYESSPNNGKEFYYIRHNEEWTQTFPGKVSLMYLHDYYLSVSDTANCQNDENNYEVCKAGWMHLSQNDSVLTGNGAHEWAMTRFGWDVWAGSFGGLYLNSEGSARPCGLAVDLSVRPVFYIDASQTLQGGIGTLENPFIIQE